MTMTDPIADMLTRIRNGQKGKFLSILVPSSKTKIAVLKVLRDEGYIASYKINADDSNKPQIEVALKYSKEGRGVIKEIHRVSKPSKRNYSQIKNLKGYYNHMGIYILSTSKGVISDREAYGLKIGGEVMCKVF
jgi:small subunit ribosomal protein S8